MIEEARHSLDARLTVKTFSVSAGIGRGSGKGAWAQVMKLKMEPVGREDLIFSLRMQQAIEFDVMY
jgi:hypothetical protein